MSIETSTGDDHAFNSAPDSSGGQASLSEPTGRHRWLTALVLGLVLATCAGAVVMYFYTPQYEASAVLMINDASPFLAFVPRDTGNDSQRYVQSQIELLRSPLVLGPVLARKDVALIQEIKAAADPVKFLQKYLSVQQVGKSELYKVSYVLCPSANGAATVANAVVAEYLEMQGRKDRQRSKLVIDVLEKERLARGVKVEQHRKRVVELAKELTGKDPFSHDMMLDVDNDSSRLVNLRERLLKVDVDRETFEAEILYLKKNSIPKEERENASVDVESQIAIRPEIRAWQAAIEENESLMEQIKGTDAKLER